MGKGQYLIVEDEEFEAIQIESTRIIDIDQFVPKSEIDERCIESPYDIAPDGQVGQDAFAVIRDTISKMNMVALGRVVLTRRGHVIALEPRGRGLLGLSLRYPYEVRDQAAYFDEIPEQKLPQKMLDLATHIVNTKSGSHFEDRYENALVDLLVDLGLSGSFNGPQGPQGTPRSARTSSNEWATYCPSTLPLRSNDQVPISSTSRLMPSGDSPALCA